ncbi:MAG: hypothetical protein WDW38_010818 [Sanguina aurantia]
MALFRLHDSLTSGPPPDSTNPSTSPSSTSARSSGTSGWGSTSYPWSELVQTGLSLYALKAPLHVGSFTNSMLDTLLEQCVSRDAPAFAVTLWTRVAAAVPLYRSLQELRSISSLCETLLAAGPQDPFLTAMGPRAGRARQACHALLCNTVHSSLHSSAARLASTSPSPHLAARELIDAVRASNWRLRSARPSAAAAAAAALPPLQPFSSCSRSR